MVGSKTVIQHPLRQRLSIVQSLLIIQSIWRQIKRALDSVHAVQVLSTMEDLTLDGLIDLAHDPYLPAFEKVIPLVQAYDRTGRRDKKIRGAIDVLRNWDMTTSKESVAMTLAHFYGMQLYREGGNPEGLSGNERFDWYGTGLDMGKRLEIFRNAFDRLEEDFEYLGNAMGEYNRFQRLSGDIDLSYDDNKPSIPVGMTTARWGL